MRKSFLMGVFSTLLAVAIVLPFVIPQPVSGQDADKDADTAGEPQKDREYLPIPDPATLSRDPAAFAGRYVQMADRFGRTYSEDAFQAKVEGEDRRRLRRQGITADSYYIFTTDPAGSKMLCFVAKDNKDAEAFFKETLVQGSRIYLMGQVGNRVFTDEGVMATFRADRLVIGDQPPARDQDAGPKEPKAIFFTVEYDMATPDGTVRREHRKYKIPKPGVRYTIANPYDPTKPLYMTFQF